MRQNSWEGIRVEQDSDEEAIKFRLQEGADGTGLSSPIKSENI